MKRWLLKQWHRFTLGRTARRVSPIGYPGSRGALVCALFDAAKQAVPVNVAIDIRARTARDVDSGTVRIVVETFE